MFSVTVDYCAKTTGTPAMNAGSTQAGREPCHSLSACSARGIASVWQAPLLDPVRGTQRDHLEVLRELAYA